jgi:hypothetical protein
LSEKHAASENVNPVYRKESLSHNDSLLTADNNSIFWKIHDLEEGKTKTVVSSKASVVMVNGKCG